MTLSVKTTTRRCVLLIFLALLFAPPVYGIGEYFIALVTITKRVGAVDSSAVATLYTVTGRFADNQEIQGSHTITSSFGGTVAGGSWVRLGEYNGYIRSFSEQGDCYRARVVASHVNGSAGANSGSFEVCFPFHSPDCGHCGPGTGNPCTQLPEDEAE